MSTTFTEAKQTKSFPLGDSDNSYRLTLDTLKWAKENFNSPHQLNLPEVDDLSSEEILSIRKFYSSSEKLNHYNSLNDLLKKLKK